MPQKIKIISSSQFIYSTAIMPKTPAKRKKETGNLTNEAESCKVCLARSAKLAKPMEVPLVVTPEAALYAHVSSVNCIIKSDVNSIVVINTIIKSFKCICRQVVGSDHEEPILCWQEEGGVYQFLG